MSLRSKILVATQFICFGYFVLFHDIIGKDFLLILQFAGIVLCVWSIFSMRIGNFNVQPEVKTGSNLTSSGPYKIIRNPMYTGILIFFLASLISDFSFISLFFFLLLSLVFILKIQDEERFLESRFGTDYTTYKSRTFRVLPYLW